MKNNKWAVFLAFTAIYIVWGSTYLAIFVAVKDFPPFLMTALRFLLAGSLLFTWCLWRKEPMPSALSVGKNAIYGILMLFGGIGSVSWAEQYLPSSLAAIIVTAVPFWFILLDKKQWSLYFSNKMIIAGLLLGFAGVIILVSFQHVSQVKSVTTREQIMGSLFILAGGISWTIGSLYSKYRPAGSSLLMNGSIQLLATGLFTFLVSTGSGETSHFSFALVSTKAWLALLYLVTMGSVVTYISYLYLLKVRPAVQVSTYVYVNPVVALLLGTVFMHDAVSWLQVLALLIILAGVLLVNMPKYKKETV